MLRQEQIIKLQNRHLETLIVSKGFYLDQEVWAEIDCWRKVLEREVEENTMLKNNLQQLSDEQKQLKQKIKEVKESGQKFIEDNQEKEIKSQNTIRLLQKQLKDKLNDFQGLRNRYQKTTDEIQELKTDLAINDELLAKKNQKITFYSNLLKKKNDRIINEVNRQAQANQKKKKQLKKASLRIFSAKQDNQLLQQEITNKSNLISQFQTEKNQQKLTILKKTTFINRQLQKIICLNKEKEDLQLEVKVLKDDKQKLREENVNKDHKIAKLKNKLSTQPGDNSDKPAGNNLPPEPNNFFMEKKELLNTIQQLRKELKDKEKILTNYLLICLLLFGVSVLFLANSLRLLIRKKRKSDKKNIKL